MYELPISISECLMTLRLKLTSQQSVTVISAYAPTLVSDEEAKEQFYAALDNVLTTIPNADKVVLLGEFNARVGKDSDLWNGIIGKEGVRKTNSNGLLLLSKCAEHNLVITNTIFRQSNKYKTT